MIVTIKIEVNDYQRKTIAAHYGRKGMATRKEIETMLWGEMQGHLDTLEDDYERNKPDAVSMNDEVKQATEGR